MSFAAHTLTQMKALFSFTIMAVIVYSWCCSYRFISLLMYSWIEYQIYGYLSFLSRDLLTPPVASVHCLYSDLRRTNDTVNTRENAEVPKSSAPARHSYLINDHVRSASTKLPVAGISSVLQLSGLWPSTQLSDASFTKKIMAYCPSVPAKEVSKTPIRVNPLGYSLCGK